ncbi:ribosome silencing factor [Xylocopilactobacillus apicola]|uniref:Ribosomal silencing factor RsfS n=1 Tax=Xylocopilactobacillus apicola TaxID=2932184 RepID=A0AAU9DMT6_9LACO|nr:ribosome silencing factor [Xylocopilactobacillus apicola]BDR58317.1 ribosomal silencing factor RsfS [Xylocopilactobacillus apicola]
MEVNTLKLVEDLAKKADQKQANDIVVLDLAGVSFLADYFMIMDVRNPRMIEALVKDLSEIAQQDGFAVKRVEGKPDSQWVLLDYGDVVVHVFTPEKRNFYNLENLWNEAKSVSINV